MAKSRTPTTVKGIPFVRTERAIGSRSRVVMASMSKLDKGLSEDKSFYVGKGGAGGIGGRYEGFGKWMTGKESWHRGKSSVEMPEVGMKDGKPYVVDGRHRLAWFRDNGFSEIPVSVSAADAKAFQQAFGSSTSGRAVSAGSSGKTRSDPD